MKKSEICVVLQIYAGTFGQTYEQSLNYARKTPSGRPIQNSSGQDNIFLDQDLKLFHAQHQWVLIYRTSFCKQHRNLTCDHVMGIRN